MEIIRPPDTFSFKQPNALERWTRWANQFNTYFIAAELSSKPKEVQVARLLNAAGAEAQEIFQLLLFETDEEKKDYKIVLKKFGEYCRPRKNVLLERQRFWNRNRRENETFDKWLMDLLVFAKECDFVETENMIRDKVVADVPDKNLQDYMLQSSSLQLEDVVHLCRAAESFKQELMQEQELIVGVMYARSRRNSVLSSSVMSESKRSSCLSGGHRSQKKKRLNHESRQRRSDYESERSQSGSDYNGRRSLSGSDYDGRRSLSGSDYDGRRSLSGSYYDGRRSLSGSNYDGRGRKSGSDYGNYLLQRQLPENVIDECTESISTMSLSAPYINSPDEGYISPVSSINDCTPVKGNIPYKRQGIS